MSCLVGTTPRRESPQAEAQGTSGSRYLPQNRFAGRYVAIEGATGAGKTTLARALAVKFGAVLDLDPFDRNPLLASLHDEKACTGLAAELAFLGLRVEALRAIGRRLVQRELVIADWALVKTFIFPFTTLPPADAARVEACCSLWSRYLPAPDLIVHLRASAPVLAARIHSRGRAFEQGLGLDELRHLAELFDRKLTGTRVLTIDADTFDVFNPIQVAQIAARVAGDLLPSQPKKDVNP